MNETPQRYPPSRLLKFLVPFLGSDLFEVLVALWHLGRKVLTFRAHEGMYESLDYEARLDILDTKGKKVVLHKRQRVRFLQDNIIAYQDKAWGDGEIFADYQCSPGVAVDRYREGHRYHVLISLRQSKRRGEEQEFNIQRTILDGFTKEIEDYQTEIDHVTRRFSISVVFPARRPPKQALLIEQNSTRRLVLGSEHTTKLPDGRVQITWKTDKPRLFEAYILRWEW